MNQIVCRANTRVFQNFRDNFRCNRQFYQDTKSTEKKPKYTEKIYFFSFKIKGKKIKLQHL